LVFCFLLFLIGTAEMQAVASTSTVVELSSQPEKVTDTTPVSVDQLRKFVDSLREMSVEFKNKFDPEGRVDKIASFFVPQLYSTDESGAQVLVKIPVNDIPVASDKIFLAAAIMLGLGSTIRMIDISSTNPEIQKMLPALKSNMSNLILLVSAALWFQGCMLFIDFLLEKGNPAPTLLYPSILRLIGSAIFSLQPTISLMKLKGTTPDDPRNDFHWANFYGILAFQVANMVSLSFMIQKTSTTKVTSVKSFFSSNEQMISMLLFTVGTSFLLSADFKVREETGVGESKAKIFTVLGDSFLVMATSLFLISDMNKQIKVKPPIATGVTTPAK